MQKSLHFWISVAAYMILSTVSYAQSDFDNAKMQMEKGLYSEALTSINQHISKNPTDSKSFMMLADLQLKLGKIDLACATYGVVESMKMTSDELYIEYGKALKMAGKYDEAITKFNMVKGENKVLAEKQIKSCQQAKDLIRNTEAKRVMNLDINSDQSEFGAFMYNNLVFFNSKKAPFMTNESVAALNDYQNNYLCKSLQNGSASALMIESPAYIKNTEAISITDNNKIAFCIVANANPNLMERMKSSKISIGEYNGFSMLNIEEFTYNSDNYSCYSPCLSDDGTTLYFASNMPGGLGGFDIYVSTKTDGAWSKPTNLGNRVNTTGDEITPFYGNGLLWFASNGLEGMGGFDIYNSQLTKDGYVAVKNADQAINTSANEMFPMIKNLVIYFTSDKEGGKGKEDIYRCPVTSRNSTIELDDVSPTLVKVIEDETPPSAYNLYAETYKRSLTTSNDDMLTGARRVSLTEFVEKAKAPVYFIQLAAMVGNDVNTAKYKPLLKYGNIYKVKVNNVYKIRLGYFIDRSSTESVLSKVRSSGFKDAFIVAEDLNSANLELLLSNSTASNPPVTTNNPPVTSGNLPKTSDYNIPSVSKNDAEATTGSSSPNFEYNKPVSKPIDVEYKVRIGSYEDPIWFDIKKVRDLGRVEQWTKGAWTIFILGGFTDMAEAEKARIQAVNRGFVDAEVVIDNGGIIERITKN